MGTSPTGTPNAGGVGKNCVFSIGGEEVSGSDAIPPKIYVYPPRWSDRPRPRRCAGGRILGDRVINNFGGGQGLLITITAQLTSTTLLIVEVSLSHIAYCSLQRYM